MSGLNQSQYMHSEALPLVNELIGFLLNIIFNWNLVFQLFKLITTSEVKYRSCTYTVYYTCVSIYNNYILTYISKVQLNEEANDRPKSKPIYAQWSPTLSEWINCTFISYSIQFTHCLTYKRETKNQKNNYSNNLSLFKQ
jgi:hypothetical protein